MKAGALATGRSCRIRGVRRQLLQFLDLLQGVMRACRDYSLQGPMRVVGRANWHFVALSAASFCLLSHFCLIL